MDDKPLAQVPTLTLGTISAGTGDADYEGINIYSYMVIRQFTKP
jgi:hypothetical protein